MTVVLPETGKRSSVIAMYHRGMDPDTSASDGPTRQRRLSEKELFLLLLVGIAVLMAITGFVLIIN